MIALPAAASARQPMSPTLPSSRSRRVQHRPSRPLPPGTHARSPHGNHAAALRVRCHLAALTTAGAARRGRERTGAVRSGREGMAADGSRSICRTQRLEVCKLRLRIGRALSDHLRTTWHTARNIATLQHATMHVAATRGAPMQRTRGMRQRLGRARRSTHARPNGARCRRTGSKGKTFAYAYVHARVPTGSLRDSMTAYGGWVR